jgi:hypothetical protein
MIQEYIGARTKRIYSRVEWEALGNEGQYKIGYADGYATCKEHGLRAANYFNNRIPLDAFEQGEKQAALDWLSDQSIKVCCNCGHLGKDVHDWRSWVGGKGYVPVRECDNIIDCWHRWDLQQK